MDKYDYYVIYKTTCKINGKIYIGQHRTNVLDDSYLGSGTLIKEDIKLYGKDAFKKEILFIFDNFEEMNDKERELVTKEFIARDDVYNRIIGGQLDDHEARKLGGVIAQQLRKKSGKNIVLSTAKYQNRLQISEEDRHTIFSALSLKFSKNIKAILF